MPSVPTDIEIAQAATLRPIEDVAAELGLERDDILLYGHTKAKIPPAISTSSITMFTRTVFRTLKLGIDMLTRCWQTCDSCSGHSR